MPNKLATTAVITAAIICSGQATAQYPTTQSSPSMSPPDVTTQPNEPANRVEPQSSNIPSTSTHNSNDLSAKKKPTQHKKRAGSSGGNTEPSSGSNDTSPKQ